MSIRLQNIQFYIHTCKIGSGCCTQHQHYSFAFLQHICQHLKIRHIDFDSLKNSQNLVKVCEYKGKLCTFLLESIHF